MFGPKRSWNPEKHLLDLGTGHGVFSQTVPWLDLPGTDEDHEDDDEQIEACHQGVGPGAALDATADERGDDHHDDRRGDVDHPALRHLQLVQPAWVVHAEPEEERGDVLFDKID